MNRTGRYVRVQLAGTNSLALGEVQVWTQAAKVEWLVTDHLGTPRISVDRTGSLAGVSRHDYLPFGEDLTVARSATPGYSMSDSVRQKFASYERDNEMGLEYAQARYYANSQGRFTGVDPLMSSAKPPMPQSWNRYSYCLNNPLDFIDPSGLAWYSKDGANNPVWFDDDPGDGYTLWTDYNYWAGDEHKWVHLSRNTSDWSDGHESREEAYQAVSFNEAWKEFTDALNKSFTWGNIKADTSRFLNEPLGRGGLGDPAFVMLGAPGPLTGLGSASATKEGTTTLFRAVLPGELDDIAAAGMRYRLPEGQAEVKGFFSTAEDAAAFSRKMFGRFPAEGSYTMTSTSVRNSFLEGSRWQYISGEGNAMFLREMPTGPVKVSNFCPIN